MNKILLLLCTLLAFAVKSQSNCADAVTLNCGDYQVGTATGTASNAPATTCGTITSSNTGGVWYSLIGEDETIGLMVNGSPGSDNDISNVQFAVYRGRCGSLTCLGGDSGGSLGYEFHAASDITYYIYVDGVGASTGDFSLAINCLPAALEFTNDICLSAAELDSNAVNIAGSTIGAANDFLPACGDAGNGNKGGVWYSYEGQGREVRVTVNGNPGNGNDLVNAEVAVFSGDCGSLVCVGGNDDIVTPGNGDAGYVFVAAAGTTYYFYIDGSGNNEGTFEISVEYTTP